MRIHHLSPLVALLLAHAPSGLAVTPIPATGRITAVTVHADRAEITREAEVRIPEGESQVEFALLPQNIDADSLRVSGHGVRAIIGAVELRDEAQEMAANPDFAAADTDVKRISAAIAEVDTRSATDADLRKYLDSLRDAASRGQSEANAALKPDAAALGQMLAFLSKNYGELAFRQLQRTASRGELVEQLALATAKRNAAAPQGSIHSRSAIVDIDASAAGSTSLELSYVVFGAGWRPTYRASLNAEGKEVELVSEAVVSQLTGEDWKDVKLTLSTAAPAKGLESPYLTSWLLEPVPPVVNGADAADISIGGGTSGQIGYRLNGPAANALSEQQPGVIRLQNKRIQDIVFLFPFAEIAQGTQSPVFIVPGRSDVASDQSEHRVTLRNDVLPVTLAYRVVPSITTEAYSVAIGKAPEDRPLLAGPMRVVAGGSFLGAFELATTGPGAEVRVPFGADNRIKVTRVTLPQARSDEGAGGKDRQVTLAFRTSIENLRDVPVTVALEERMPVAQDERVSVKISASKTSPGSIAISERPGVLNWKLELAPKEKRDISLEYSVRHPKDMVLPGL